MRASHFAVLAVLAIPSAANSEEVDSLTAG